MNIGPLKTENLPVIPDSHVSLSQAKATVRFFVILREINSDTHKHKHMDTREPTRTHAVYFSLTAQL